MAEVEATLPPLAAPASAVEAPQPPPEASLAQLQLADPAPAGQASDASTTAPKRLPVHLHHTTSSRQHATVDPQAEGSGSIKALLRREAPRLGAGGAGGGAAGAAGSADYVRHKGENIRDLVAKKRQVRQ
jgi:hypothetical protein